MDYTIRSLETYSLINSKDWIADAYLNLAEIYQHQNKSKKVIQNSKKALDILEGEGSLKTQKRAFKLLAQSYETLGYYKQSLMYYKEERLLSDSIFSESNRDTINELTQKYKYEQQEQTIYTQELQLEKQEALLERQSANRYLLVGVIVFLMIFALLGFFFIRQKQEANNQ